MKKTRMELIEQAFAMAKVKDHFAWNALGEGFMAWHDELLSLEWERCFISQEDLEDRTTLPLCERPMLNEEEFEAWFDRAKNLLS